MSKVGAVLRSSNSVGRGTTRIRFRYPVWIAGLVGLAAFGVVACDDPVVAAETRSETFSVGDAPVLEVRVINGSVEVRAGDAGVLTVVATLTHPDKLTYDVRQDGDRVTVDVGRRDGVGVFNFGRSPGADVVVVAPAETVLGLRTSNGGVIVEGIQASGTVDTSNGRITLREVAGDYDLDTSNGAVQVTGYRGNIRVETSNSSITVEQAVGQFDVETSNGRVALSAELTAGGSNAVRTSNGSVSITLLGTPSVRLDATTSNGAVSNDHPIVATRMDGAAQAGTIGAGDASLVVRSSNGSISIR